MTTTWPNRHERLGRGLEERGRDSVVLVGADHATHFSGYNRYLSGGAVAFVVADGKRTLVVPRYELAAAEQDADADDVVGYGADDFLDFDPLPTLIAACRERINGRVAIAGADAADWTRVDDLVAAIRRVKDADEIERIAESYGIALAAQEKVAQLAAEGASEIDLFSAAQTFAQQEVGAPVEFISGVHTGPNSAAVAPPVHIPGARRAAPGEPVLADIALRASGYWGDSTRTSVVGRNDEVEQTRDSIAQILAETGSSLRAGIRAADVFEDMRGAILARFPEGRFPHHGGHGIGVNVAEDPQLIPSEPMTLEAGMVFAVEPGVYYPGRFGVRVEDIYVVGESGGVRIDQAYQTSSPSVA